MSVSVSMMQPSFLPWQGLFELICHSDKFIFLDDFQFSVGSHHNRNRLFVATDKVDYYTVPIQKNKSFTAPLNRTLIVEGDFWKKKFFKRLEGYYKKHPYYSDVIAVLANWLSEPYTNLACLNIKFILIICRLLKIRCEFLYSSDFTRQTNSISVRSKRVCELLNWSRADKYLSAFGSFNYMLEDGIFPLPDIETVFQNYIPPRYSQKNSTEFVPYLSILDALFNIGYMGTLSLITSGTAKWLTWAEMSERNSRY